MVTIIDQWLFYLYSKYVSHIDLFLISNYHLSIQIDLSVIHPRLEGKDQRIVQAFFALFLVKLFLGVF